MSDQGREPGRHYDRARRLANASAEVRWLSELDPKKRPGLFGALFATRSLRMVAMLAAMAAVAYGVASYVSNRNDGVPLAGSTWTVSTLGHGGDLLATIRRRGAPGDPALPVTLRLEAEGFAESSELEAFTDGEAVQEFYLSLRGAGAAKSARVVLSIDGKSAVVSP